MLHLIAALLLQATPDLCADRVQDQVNRPRLPFVLDAETLAPIYDRPAVGRWFIDPSFGTSMKFIARPSSAEGANAVIKTMYGTTQAWNADESLLLLWHRAKGHELYLGDEPYTFVRLLGIAPADLEQVLWDPEDPRVFYYPDRFGKLIRVTLGPAPSYVPVESVVFDFNGPPTNCPAGGRFGLGNDPEANLQGGRRLLGLMCGPNGSTKILYSITEGQVVSWTPTSGALGPIAPVAAPSETRLYFGGGFVTGLDFAFQRRLTAASYFEHGQVGADAEGDTMNMVAFTQSSPGANDAGTLVSHDLATGRVTPIIGPATGYEYIASGTHHSTTGPKGWVFTCSIGGAHTGAFMGDNECWLSKTDDGARKVCRVGHNRTWAGTNCGSAAPMALTAVQAKLTGTDRKLLPIPGPSAAAAGNECPWGYWGETHPPHSRKGTRALISTDWLGSDAVGVLVLDFRREVVRMDCATRLKLLSFNPYLTTTESNVCTVVK